MARSQDVKEPAASTQTTFKFDARTVAMIEQLKKEFGATTKAEVIRKALALLELARRAREQGGDIAVMDHEGRASRVLLPY
jgi:hypothetical protein